MRPFFKHMALAATLLTVTAAGAVSASAGDLSVSFRDGPRCDRFCRDGFGFAPPPVVERRDTVEVVPVPEVVTRRVYVNAPPVVTPVYVDIQNPQLFAIRDQLSADHHAIDAERGNGQISDATYWRFRGQGDAIHAELKSLDRGGYVSGARLTALQGEVSNLTREIDNAG